MNPRISNVLLLTPLSIYWFLFIYLSIIISILFHSVVFLSPIIQKKKKSPVNILSVFIFTLLNLAFLQDSIAIYSRPCNFLLFPPPFLTKTNTRQAHSTYIYISRSLTILFSVCLVLWSFSPVLFACENGTWISHSIPWKLYRTILPFFPTLQKKNKEKIEKRINLFQLLLKKSFTWRGFSTEED